MKPYFTKYLPVEGEIKEGQTGISINNATYTHFNHLGKNYGKPAKLFLCSRDIQVGDNVFYKEEQTKFEKIDHDEGYPEWVFSNSQTYHAPTNGKIWDKEIPPFKVIGEISPEALTYVKKGDEFDEESIKRIYAAEVRKEYRNGEDKSLVFVTEEYNKDCFIQDKAEYWAEHENMSGHNYGYELHWGDAILHHIEIKGPCGHFH